MLGRTMTLSPAPLRAPGLVLALLAGACLSHGALARPPLAAEGVTYTTVSRAEMGGSLGAVVRFLPGTPEETRETTYMQGPLLRTDQGEESSSITDMTRGRFTYLDHREKTYHTFSLDEMMAQAEGVVGQLQAAESPEEGGKMEFQVERTGRTRSFDGYTAEQFLMIMEGMPALTGPEEGEEGGSMVLLVELWMSQDFPGYQELRKAQESMAHRGLPGVGEAFAAAPGTGEAARRLAEEMKGMDGIPVRTVSSFVLVPPGAILDREAVLAAADQPLSTGGELGEALGRAAVEGARDGARQAMGGLLGRRRQPEAPPPAAAPATPDAPQGQSIVMRVTQVVESVRVGAIPEERFQIPAGYREEHPVIR